MARLFQVAENRGNRSGANSTSQTGWARCRRWPEPLPSYAARTPYLSTVESKLMSLSARKPCGSGRLSTVHLLVPTSPDESFWYWHFIFTFVTKQAALVWRSTVLNLPVQLVFSAECDYSLIGHYHEIKVHSYTAYIKGIWGWVFGLVVLKHQSFSENC